MDFKHDSYLTRLLYINIGVFIVVGIATAILTVSGNSNSAWVAFLEMPASVGQFILQPWSIITYMFLHVSFLHLIFNILVLYWFGKLFLEYYTQKQLTSLYIIGGLFGGALYMAGYNLLPYFQDKIENTYLLGASASVMAVIFASVITEPDKKIHLTFIGDIKLKYLGLIFLVIDLMGVGATNAGGSMAHLGGAMAGCLFALLITKKGIDICTPINAIIGFFANLGSGNERSFKFRKRPKGSASDAEWSAYEAETKKHNNARIDEILDKIKKSGYDSLTPEEKKELFDISK
ncbi:MAG: rhomboid family intramembrane serine protease [Paludibacteraceae bacterium]|nr:rhomboid family intramembrane serine protease [Paludibacteraceae bacterium]